jgi:hypothetical protein
MDADDSRLVTLYDRLGDDPASILARLLDLHAARTGQNCARHAARVLRGAVQSGRRGFDDTAAIRRVMAFPPRQRHQAVSIVAKFTAGPGATERQIAAIAQRLRRKMRGMVLCISSDC